MIWIDKFKNMFQRGTLLIAAIAIWGGGVGTAADIIDVRPITPVPDIVVSSGEPEELQPAKLRNFHGGGVVTRIGKDEQGKRLIVIGDRLFYFSASAKYHSKEGGEESFSRFGPGNKVGFLLNGERDITELYFLGD